MQYEDYSVLMSVYYKEKPEYLKQSIQSMLDQTVSTNDFVIVCDGPLTPELDAVLEDYKNQKPEVFNIVRLEQNVGIGAAVNEGLKHCKNELIAKMDADDIAMPERCELQIARFNSNEKLTVLGGYMDEFDEDFNHPYAMRKVPLTYEAIYNFAKRRQPFNNITVMLKKSAVIHVGGYSNMNRCEDYDLYVRLLSKGYYCENLENVLCRARVERNALSRRSSLETLKWFVKSRWNVYKIHYSSLVDFLIACTAQIIVFVCPNFIQKFLYEKFLRS